MARIEMLDEFGKVTGTYEATADSEAVCEDGENLQERSRCGGPVYRWTTADGMTFEACRAHIKRDQFSRLKDE